MLPIEYDDLTFVELEPGRRFLERSPTLTQRVWQHERIVEPTADCGVEAAVSAASARKRAGRLLRRRSGRDARLHSRD